MSALRIRLLAATALALATATARDASAQGPSHPAPDRAPTSVVRLAASRSGTIYGTVVDERGAPIEGAVVSALGGATAFAVTDGTGQYRMTDLPVGPYVVRAHREGFAGARSSLIDVRAAAPAPQIFTLRRVEEGAPSTVQTAGVAVPGLDPAPPRDESPLAWRLRRLTRSVLKDETPSSIDLDRGGRDWFDDGGGRNVIARAFDASARFAANVIDDWPLSGQVNFLTAAAYDDTGDMVAFGPPSGVAFFAVGAPVGDDGDWSARAAMNGGDLTSWTMAGDYRSRASASQQLSFGLTYSFQAYRGGNVAALQAVPEGHRKVASLHGSHAFALSPRLTLGYGARYEHYDYLGGYGLLSPTVRIAYAPTRRTQVYAKASVRNVAPGAEEFVPPTDAWVPPQRTFAPLSGERFNTEHVRHVEGGVSRQFGATTVSAAAFVQTVDDQLVTVFGAADPERLIAAGGHYGVASAGDAAVRGWRVGVERQFLPYVLGRAVYTTSSADWTPASRADRRALRTAAPDALNPDERVHDLLASLDAEVPQTDTRLIVLYQLNSAFAAVPAAVPMGNGRFDVQLRQGLPLTDRVGDWEMLIGVRSMFRTAADDRSVYDELLVIRAPKRVTCGLQIRF
jgi:hypothetical protein